MNDYFAEYQYIVGEYVRLRHLPGVYKITYIDTDINYANLINVRNGGIRSATTTDIYPLSKQETAEFLIDKMFKPITT